MYTSFTLPVISEKASDFDVFEEFERLEQEYMKTISRLELTLEDTLQKVEIKKQELSEAKLKTKKIEMLSHNELMQQRMDEIQSLDEQLNQMDELFVCEDLMMPKVDYETVMATIKTLIDQ